MYVVLTMKDIIGKSIFVSGHSNKCRNGAWNVVDLSSFSSFSNI